MLAPTSPASVSLTGSGIAAVFKLGINPTSLSFENVVTGTCFTTQNVIITITGDANIASGNESRIHEPCNRYHSMSLPR